MGMEPEYFQRSIQMAKGHMKRCSTSLIIRDMQSKTIISPHTFQNGDFQKDKKEGSYRVRICPDLQGERNPSRTWES